MIDINDYDVPENALNPEVHEAIAEKELRDQIDENLKKQYQNLDELGVNYLNNINNIIDNNSKIFIYNNMLSYIHNNIINIPDIDAIDDDFNRLILISEYVYEFICVDTVNSIIPALMELLNISTVEDFDLIINLKYNESPNKLKEDLLQTIHITLNQLQKLQTISPIVKNDNNYNKLLGKYLYIEELISLCDIDKFLTNFIRPVISKYISDIVWKLF